MRDRQTSHSNFPNDGAGPGELPPWAEARSRGARDALRYSGADVFIRWTADEPPPRRARGRLASPPCPTSVTNDEQRSHLARSHRRLRPWDRSWLELSGRLRLSGPGMDLSRDGPGARDRDGTGAHLTCRGGRAFRPLAFFTDPGGPFRTSSSRDVHSLPDLRSSIRTR
jgi:hypothetical protein